MVQNDFSRWKRDTTTRFRRLPTDGAAEEFTTSGDKMAAYSTQPETAGSVPKNMAASPWKNSASS